jgi:trimeric autotransporter adhesin
MTAQLSSVKHNRHSIIPLHIWSSPCLIYLLVCLVVLPGARAVTPAPDGGYPNNNTAEGDFALQLLTGGTDNTAVGTSALYSNLSGSNNIAIGVDALVSNTEGNYNTAVGYLSLFSNTTDYNTALGSLALYGNTSGAANTAIGFASLSSNVDGFANTALGRSALYSSIHAGYNTALGTNALLSDTDGAYNTAAGALALWYNTSGSFNMASGGYSLYLNTTGSDNLAAGYQALYNNTTGSSNIALGGSAGLNLTTGSNNVDIGNKGVAGEAKTIRIGTKGTHTTTLIAGIAGKTVAAGVGVLIDTNGKMGTINSSERFKEAIKPMDTTSEAILALKPVTFRYKKELDPAGVPQFGLVAEDVEKVNPDLVARDEEGQPYTVRYEAVNAMLLNEFLKEHRKVEQQDGRLEQQQRTIAKQQKQIEALTAGLQKVSAQIELSKSAPEVAENN